MPARPIAKTKTRHIPNTRRADALAVDVGGSRPASTGCALRGAVADRSNLRNGIMWVRDTAALSRYTRPPLAFLLLEAMKLVNEVPSNEIAPEMNPNLEGYAVSSSHGLADEEQKEEVKKGRNAVSSCFSVLK